MDDTLVDFLEDPPNPIRNAFVKQKDYIGNTYSRIYAEKCYINKSVLYDSVLHNCELAQCTLVNCLLTSGDYHWTTHCNFENCQIIGTKESPYCLYRSNIINCKIEHGFMHLNRSLKDTEAKDRVAARTATYEVFNQLLLPDCVVDYLRRWAWRTKRRLKVLPVYGPPLSPAMQKARDDEADSSQSLGSSPNSDSTMDDQTSSESEDGWGQLHPIREGSQFKDATIPRKTLAVDNRNKDILTVWSAKKAGKRPFHVNELYHVEQQLEMPLARAVLWDGTRERKRFKFAETYGGGAGA
ncbi:hypothetical protein FKW77_004475 [Venturia effusa]|uniref:Uncharacterized protein n=1 Tax=Venturia effusa TaxID=50376 RepID=A0A517KW86_9PEZI|nr:hypothetical protein FKW77_004475 [Venturia effusa]